MSQINSLSMSLIFKKHFKFMLLVFLMGAAAVAQAKEIELVLNAQTQYPMKIHYKFSRGNIIYGQGEMLIQPNAITHYVDVNRVPDEDNVLVQIDQMTVGNRTEINDPCEMDLAKNDLTAAITIGFTGDPETHGSFNCTVSA